MKYLIVVAALAAAPAMANELDRDFATQVTADQIEKSKDLPGTTVIRVNPNDPSDVAIAFVKEKLKPGQKAMDLKFEKINANKELTGIAYASKNELDAGSSTSSWVVGWRGPFTSGVVAGGWNRYYRPYYGGYYPSYGYGYNYGYGYGYSNYYGGCGSYCYPTYAYAGYNYGYTPYYQYSGYGYNYYNCGWVY